MQSQAFLLSGLSILSRPDNPPTAATTLPLPASASPASVQPATEGETDTHATLPTSSGDLPASLWAQATQSGIAVSVTVPQVNLLLLQDVTRADTGSLFAETSLEVSVRGRISFVSLSLFLSLTLSLPLSLCLSVSLFLTVSLLFLSSTAQLRMSRTRWWRCVPSTFSHLTWIWLRDRSWYALHSLVALFL